MLRTALFNWAFARHAGGTFVFRIEDTDSERDSEESFRAVVEAMRWLRLDWDEGPEVGGPFGPYRQSQRRGIYQDVARQLLAAGDAYYCYCTSEQLAERREAARAAGKPSGYDGTCRDLTATQIADYEVAGRLPVLRFRMPDQDWSFDDLVRGEVTFKAAFQQDFVLVRANGDPLYPLVNPVDDALMHITHVLRGEDLLSSTPRQLALHAALAKLDISSGRLPQFGHLPYVMGEGNKKLSKRDPQAAFSHYPAAGFLPEGFANYLAMLGWSLGNDVEFFSLDQMAAAFDISRVNASPARFDIKKCTAVNGDWIRALPIDDLAGRIVPFLVRSGVLPDEPSPQQLSLVKQATPLVSERLEVLAQAVGMMSFLFADSRGCQSFELDPTDAAKLLDERGRAAVAAALAALADLPVWECESIHQALQTALVEGLQLKPRLAFGPIRVAITGRRVSPPLFESMELLGRERSLARLADAAAAFEF